MTLTNFFGQKVAANSKAVAFTSESAEKKQPRGWGFLFLITLCCAVLAIGLLGCCWRRGAVGESEWPAGALNGGGAAGGGGAPVGHQETAAQQTAASPAPAHTAAPAAEEEEDAGAGSETGAETEAVQPTPTAATAPTAAAAPPAEPSRCHCRASCGCCMAYSGAVYAAVVLASVLAIEGCAGGSQEALVGSHPPEVQVALEALEFALDASPTKAEVNRCYRKLSLVHHPDMQLRRNKQQSLRGADDAEERFKAINNAHKFLLGNGVVHFDWLAEEEVEEPTTTTATA